MERLNKAATAAGFAMAAADEDTFVEAEAASPSGEEAARAIVRSRIAEPARPAARESLMSFAGWMRNVVPSFGGRAPA